MTREIDTVVAGIGKAPTKGPEVRAERERTPQAPESHSSVPVASATLSLTETSVRVQELQVHVASLPVVDEQRVQAVKQAIARGSYEIDPVRVAEKIVSLELALSDKA